VRALFVVLLLTAAFPAAARLQVGAAAVAINPEVDSYLAGYDRDRRVQGIHDDVFVKAVVVKDEQQALAFVVVDCIGLLFPDVARIRQRVADLLDSEQLEPERIIVSSTHTHSGPDVAGLWGGHLFSSGRDEDYIDRLVETAALQIVAAFEAMQPAVMKADSALLQLSWVRNLSEPGLLDDRFNVIQFSGLDGSSIATLSNFPCHPTVLGPENHLVSADYLGGFYQAMDRRYGGVNLFLQGAIGGWVQPEQGDRSFELARDYGEMLALVSMELLRYAQPISRTSIAFASRSFEIPLQNWGFRLLMFLGVVERDLVAGQVPTQVAWGAIGPVQFATHPGETSPAYSLATRELMGSPRYSMVLGLGLDALGYILKPDFFDNPDAYPHADYLTTVSVGPAAAPSVMQALASIIPPAADSESKPLP